MALEAPNPDTRSWLEARQATLQTTPGIIDRIVREATGEPVITKTRLLLGEAHEIYDIKTGARRPDLCTVTSVLTIFNRKS